MCKNCFVGGKFSGINLSIFLYECTEEMVTNIFKMEDPFGIFSPDLCA